MPESVSNEVEHMRGQVFTDPLRVMEIGQPLMTELGVTASFDSEPELYIYQVRRTDPRYANSKGEARNISRQDVNAKAHTMTDDMLISGVMNAAENLGILTPSYPFDQFALTADNILVTGGTIGALRERTEFAIQSVEDEHVPIIVVGGNRLSQAAELKKLEEEGKDPTAYPTEVELAELTAEEMRVKYPDHNVSSYAIRTSNPQNLHTIRETFISKPNIGRLALVTTHIYVPFTTMDANTVITELGGEVEARAYAGESSPAAVASRKIDTYRSEVIRTLTGAANWHIARTQRTI